MINGSGLDVNMMIYFHRCFIVLEKLYLLRLKQKLKDDENKVITWLLTPLLKYQFTPRKKVYEIINQILMPCSN